MWEALREPDLTFGCRQGGSGVQIGGARTLEETPQQAQLVERRANNLKFAGSKPCQSIVHLGVRVIPRRRAPVRQLPFMAS